MNDLLFRYDTYCKGSTAHVVTAYEKSVGDDRTVFDPTGSGRLDFDVTGASLDKEAITAQLNTLIAAGHEVTPRWIADEELQARPELVRTMSVKPPAGAGRVRLMEVAGLDAAIDLQPCGGTHIRNTAEIGPVIIGKIENKGRQNRRINIAFAE